MVGIECAPPGQSGAEKVVVGVEEAEDGEGGAVDQVGEAPRDGKVLGLFERHPGDGEGGGNEAPAERLQDIFDGPAKRPKE